MFKKVKKFELRGRICEVVAAERLINIRHHIWYKNGESVNIPKTTCRITFLFTFHFKLNITHLLTIFR